MHSCMPAASRTLVNGAAGTLLCFASWTILDGAFQFNVFDDLALEHVGRPRACPQWPALMREDTRAETTPNLRIFEFDFDI